MFALDGAVCKVISSECRVQGVDAGCRKLRAESKVQDARCCLKIAER
jgi:hypothetical protein